MSEFDKKCSKCRNYNGNILICESCAHYKPKQTVFQRITTSPEMLVDKLVYDWGHLCHNGDVKIYWKSTILLDAVFYSKSEAISATLEELNKVSK